MNNFKMAYLINCHKNVEQLNNLINQLDCDNVDFYIHVDKKSNILNDIIKKNNIYFTSQRVDVIWGDSSQVIATIKLFESIKESGNNYHYIHFLSGQDYPLMPNTDIKAFFYNYYGKQFIDCSLMEGDWLRRVEVYYPRYLMGNKQSISIIRALYSRIIMKSILFRREVRDLPIFYQGSSWFSITEDAMIYILDYLKEHQDFLKFLDNTLCCDEFVFQTILANSIYKNDIVENMRYIDWTEKKSSPKILTEVDLPKILDSKKIFGRKFDIMVDKVVINKINKIINQEKEGTN